METLNTLHKKGKGTVKLNNILFKVPDDTMIDFKNGDKRPCTQGYIHKIMNEWFITEKPLRESITLFLIGDEDWSPIELMNWEIIKITK